MLQPSSSSVWPSAFAPKADLLQLVPRYRSLMQNSLTPLQHSAWPGSVSCCPRGQGHGPSVMQSSRWLAPGSLGNDRGRAATSAAGLSDVPGSRHGTALPFPSDLAIRWKKPPAEGAISTAYISVLGIYAAPTHCSPTRVLPLTSLPCPPGEVQPYPYS